MIWLQFNVIFATAHYIKGLQYSLFLSLINSTNLLFGHGYSSWGVSLVAQLVKNPPAMQETLVWFLGQKDPLEEGMATHSSILAWRIPMDRGAWWATVHGVTKRWTWPSDWEQHRTHHGRGHWELGEATKSTLCFLVETYQPWVFMSHVL